MVLLALKLGNILNDFLALSKTISIFSASVNWDIKITKRRYLYVLWRNTCQDPVRFCFTFCDDFAICMKM